jgi:outer membrane lipoprotein LolB
VVLLLGLLAGCAQLPERAPGEAASGGFELKGRVAVRYGQDAASGRVQWRHTEDRDELLITNPLGQGVARITRSDGLVLLETPEGQSYRAHDAESLTEQVLGWRLPLQGLQDWVRGRPGPSLPSSHIQRDSSGQLALLRQDGWDVEYQEYARSRPARMRLTHPGVDIRLVIETMQDPLP